MSTDATTRDVPQSPDTPAGPVAGDPSAAQHARAFNRGSDARLVGRPVTANPYGSHTTALGRYWTWGWQNVETEWGAGARWPYRAKPDFVPGR